MKRAPTYSLVLLSSAMLLLLSACGTTEPEVATLSTQAGSSHTGASPAVHMQLKVQGTNDIVCYVYNTPATTKPTAQNCPSGTYTEQLFGSDWKQVGPNKAVTIGAPTNPNPGNPPNLASAVYSQTFDSVPVGNYEGSSDLNVQTCSGQGRCLQALYRPDSRGSPRFYFKENLPAAREYTLTYDLRFDKNFEWVQGGKLPGLSPTNSVTGCTAPRDDGWSVRLMWRKAGSLGQYLYHQDKSDTCGEDVTAKNFTLQKDRWYDVAIYVRVNSSASAKDGQVLLFVDGKEVARRDNLRLRKTTAGGLIEQFQFSSFYGGADPTWAPPRTTYAYFDDFTVYPGLRTR